MYVNNNVLCACNLLQQWWCIPQVKIVSTNKHIEGYMENVYTMYFLRLQCRRLGRSKWGVIVIIITIKQHTWKR